MTDKLLIDRELLERIDESAICDGTDATISDELFTQLVAALTQPAPAEGEVVAYMDHHDTLSHSAPGTDHFALMTVAQHQRMMVQRDAKLEWVLAMNKALDESNLRIGKKLAGVVEALRAENERLRKAAEAIREFEKSGWRGSSGYHAGLLKAAQIADDITTRGDNHD